MANIDSQLDTMFLLYLFIFIVLCSSQYNEQLAFELSELEGISYCPKEVMEVCFEIESNNQNRLFLVVIAQSITIYYQT